MEQSTKIKLVFTLCVIGIVFFVGSKFVPVKLKNSQLEDAIVEAMKFAGTPELRTKEAIRGRIWEAVYDLGLTEYIDKRDIKVDKTSSMVRVKLYYERVIELPGYTYTFKFDFDRKRQIF